MSVVRRKFHRGSSDQRKQDLIEATLSLVAEKGVRGATVRAIAAYANVTQGLIRHYFSSKEDLVTATYERHMDSMTAATLAPLETVEGTAQERLAAFVRASLKPPVMTARSVALWASFLHQVQKEPKMRETHAQSYNKYRNNLEELIKAALQEAGQPSSAERLHVLSIACNAVIDGLWLEGGALPDTFDPDLVGRIGVESVGAIIGLDLNDGESQSENS